jgi:putative cell wall-binding protein
MFTRRANGGLRERRVTALVGAAALVASLVVTLASPATAATTTRVAGADRFSTAVELSKTRFGSGVPVVYVANGYGWADALAAGPAAAHLGGPVLLVGPDAIPTVTANELNRLDPDRIVVVGGTAIVSPSVESALAAYAPTVDRIAGAWRYATGAAISTDAFDSAAVAVIASGEKFADAMAGVPAAKVWNAPILLVTPNSVPAEVTAALDTLNVTSVKILGGTGVVSSNVESNLKSLLGASNVQRIAGASRAYTAVATSKAAFGPGVAAAYLAYGGQFADALAAGPVAALAPGPILLVEKNCVPEVVNAELTRLAPTSIVVVGGTSVTGSGVYNRTVCPVGPRTPTVSGLTGPRWENDAYEDDAAPDPYVVKFGNTWYTYATGSAWGNLIGILKSSSASPTTGWTTNSGWEYDSSAFGSNPVSKLPSWQEPHTQWAPGVYRWGTGANSYKMFYAAKSKLLMHGGHWCISVAHSSSPAGPFVDTSTMPIVCQPSLGGSIDPQPFIDADGSPWLHWKNNDGWGHPAVSKVWAVKLGINGESPYGSHYEVMAKDTQARPWQTTLDNPQMVVYGGQRYLFYASGNWDDQTYVVGYARCASVTGGCVSAANPILGSYGTAKGTGGGNAVYDPGSGKWYLSYHAWDTSDTSCTNDACGGTRKLYIANLAFL